MECVYLDTYLMELKRDLENTRDSIWRKSKLAACITIWTFHPKPVPPDEMISFMVRNFPADINDPINDEKALWESLIETRKRALVRESILN
jgi:hypothetical protein